MYLKSKIFSWNLESRQSRWNYGHVLQSARFRSFRDRLKRIQNWFDRISNQFVFIGFLWRCVKKLFHRSPAMIQAEDFGKISANVSLNGVVIVVTYVKLDVESRKLGSDAFHDSDLFWVINFIVVGFVLLESAVVWGILFVAIGGPYGKVFGLTNSY